MPNDRTTGRRRATIVSLNRPALPTPLDWLRLTLPARDLAPIIAAVAAAPSTAQWRLDQPTAMRLRRVDCAALVRLIGTGAWWRLAVLLALHATRPGGV